MRTLFCQTEEQTQRLGLCLGACLRPGDVVLMFGEMGAGKSVLTRAAARALGVEGPVPSPTFTILNMHEGKAMRLYHFDLYRLEGADALYEMGLDEFIPARDGACLIEWPERALRWRFAWNTGRTASDAGSACGPGEGLSLRAWKRSLRA